MLDAAHAGAFIDGEGGLTRSQAQNAYLLARDIEASEGIDKGVHDRIVRPNSAVDHDIAVILDAGIIGRRGGGVERHMRDLLVPVLLIVGMVRRLVKEGLTVTSLEARDHQSGDGIIEHLSPKIRSSSVVRADWSCFGLDHQRSSLDILPLPAAGGKILSPRSM